jgi:thioredoxin reductase (NADPH)
MQKHQICVDTEKFQTSTLGIYAVGDLYTYAGKRKLMVSGFHEAALAAYAIKQSFEAPVRTNTKYTSNSSLLQDRLGLS